MEVEFYLLSVRIEIKGLFSTYRIFLVSWLLPHLENLFKETESYCFKISFIHYAENKTTSKFATSTQEKNEITSKEPTLMFSWNKC